MLRFLRAIQRMAGTLPPASTQAIGLRIGSSRWSLGAPEWQRFVEEGGLTSELGDFAETARALGIVEWARLPLRHQGNAHRGLLVLGLTRTPTAAESEQLTALAEICAASNQDQVDLAVLIEELPFGISIMSKDGSLHSVNRRARQLGDALATPDDDWRTSLQLIRVEDLNGRPIPPHQLPVVRAMNGESMPPRELVLVGLNGQRHAMVTSTEPLRDADGNIDRVAFTFQDITSLYELADSRDRFLRIASHELRSPLTALGASTGLLRLDPSALVDENRRDTLLSRIDRQVGRLHQLVEQLLDGARIANGERTLQRTPCDLVQIIDEACEQIGVRESHALVADKPRSLEWLVDGPRFSQVLINLLSNAVRYSEKGSTVTVQLVGDEDAAVVHIEDRGIGIAPDELTRLFAPFFRGTNAVTTHRGGLGLGLHISHDIVRQHGGTLTAQSTLGQGTRFTVTLPRVTA